MLRKGVSGEYEIASCDACGATVAYKGEEYSGWLFCEIDRGKEEVDLDFCSAECSERWIREAQSWPADNVHVEEAA